MDSRVAAMPPLSWPLLTSPLPLISDLVTRLPSSEIDPAEQSRRPTPAVSNQSVTRLAPPSKIDPAGRSRRPTPYKCHQPHPAGPDQSFAAPSVLLHSIRAPPPLPSTAREVIPPSIGISQQRMTPWMLWSGSCGWKLFRFS
jgi:hypothetical protein